MENVFVRNKALKKNKKEKTPKLNIMSRGKKSARTPESHPSPSEPALLQTALLQQTGEKQIP